MEETKDPTHRTVWFLEASHKMLGNSPWPGVVEGRRAGKALGDGVPGHLPGPVPASKLGGGGIGPGCSFHVSPGQNSSKGIRTYQHTYMHACIHTYTHTRYTTSHYIYTTVP